MFILFNPFVKVKKRWMDGGSFCPTFLFIFSGILFYSGIANFPTQTTKN